MPSAAVANNCTPSSRISFQARKIIRVETGDNGHAPAQVPDGNTTVIDATARGKLLHAIDDELVPGEIADHQNIDIDCSTIHRGGPGCRNQQSPP